jgi:hypothetical protein
MTPDTSSTTETTGTTGTTRTADCQHMISYGDDGMCDCAGTLEFASDTQIAACGECGTASGSLSAAYQGWPHSPGPWPQQITDERAALTQAWRSEHAAGHPHARPAGRGRPCPICLGWEITEHLNAPDIHAARPRWHQESLRVSARRPPADPRTLSTPAVAHLRREHHLDTQTKTWMARALREVGFTVENDENKAWIQATDGVPVAVLDLTAASRTGAILGRAPVLARGERWVIFPLIGDLGAAGDLVQPEQPGHVDYTELARIATTYVTRPSAGTPTQVPH